MKLNLGCGSTLKNGFVNIDKIEHPEIMYIDLENGLLGIEDNSVDYIEAHHVLEHIVNFNNLILEIKRVCKPGARIDIIVPLGNTMWDIADPSHVRRFNHKTFEYYCDHFITSYPTPKYFKMITQNLHREPNQWFQGIEWIVANLHVVLEVL